MIHLITGCMGSGKSAKLIELYDRYSSNGDRIFVASCSDSDQESDYITSRNSYKVFTNTAINNKFITMVKASSETVKSNLAKSYDVFILDECQWLDLEVFTQIFKPLAEFLSSRAWRFSLKRSELISCSSRRCSKTDAPSTDLISNL